MENACPKTSQGWIKILDYYTERGIGALEAGESQPAPKSHTGSIWTSDSRCQTKRSRGKSPCGHQLVWGGQGAQERAENAPQREAERMSMPSADGNRNEQEGRAEDTLPPRDNTQRARKLQAIHMDLYASPNFRSCFNCRTHQSCTERARSDSMTLLLKEGKNNHHHTLL